MKILVTGTAGFIGYHLALKLLQRGDTMIQSTIYPNHKFIKMDLADTKKYQM